MLDTTITCGQAFGGDIEAINVYTALIAAKEVAGADVAIVCQGPGNAGSNTRYGFSGIQQGEALNAAGVLGGRPIMVLSMSFADKRERHRGVSHHSLTILEKVALASVAIGVPELPEDKSDFIAVQLSQVADIGRHAMQTVDGNPGIMELESRDIRVLTMGRCIDEDREFFLAASAGGVVVAKMIE